MRNDNRKSGERDHYGYENDVRSRGHNTGWEDHYPTSNNSGKYDNQWAGSEHQNASQHTWGEHSTSAVSHRGKGPRGYKRSDSRIEEDINEALMQDHHVDSSEVEVSVVNGDVMLLGNVETRVEKRRAEDIAESIPGVTNVEKQDQDRKGCSQKRDPG
ncbi:MAG: BON domain-containing protein [Bacteroidota bacterium]